MNDPLDADGRANSDSQHEPTRLDVTPVRRSAGGALLAGAGSTQAHASHNVCYASAGRLMLTIALARVLRLRSAAWSRELATHFDGERTGRRRADPHS